MTDWPERTLKLKASVGSGDLATIYAASDVERGQSEFAVAILHYDLKDLEGVASAMAKRIESSKGVDHPAMVRCEGVFRVSDRPSVVMEMVDGKDLDRLAKRRSTPAAVAARIGLELTSFLVAAKAKGMVHGLLGPARVCIDNDGQVRVMGGVTPTGTTVDDDHPIYREERGTSRYAAPELMGGLLTTPNDVYAVGGILTLLISGRWPQRPATSSDAQSHVINGARQQMSAGDAPASLVELVASCLSFRPDQRPTLSELQQGLGSLAAKKDAWLHWVNPTLAHVTGTTEVEEEEDPESVVESEPVAADEGVEESVVESEAMAVDGDVEESVVESESAVDLDEAAAEPTVILEPVSESDEEVEAQDVVAETAETALDEPSDEEEVSSEPETPSPVVLGKLPPPPSDEVVAMPSADDDPDSSSLWKDEDDFPEEPDTEDEPTEVASMATRMETDEQADQWDRMLALDKKSVASTSASIDKEWSRMARGESEGRRFVLMAVIGLGIGLAAAWYAGLLNFNDDSATDKADIQTIDDVQVEMPAAPVEEPSTPEPVPEVAPEEKTVEPVEDEEPPAVVPVVPVPTTDAPPPAPPVEPKPPPATPAPTKTKAPPPPPPEEKAVEPAPEETPEVVEPTPKPPPVPLTAAVRITGDASMVHLVSGSRRLNGGRIPPGEYQIEVVFKQNDMPQNQGSLRLEAGQSAIVNCKASFYRCTVRGPW